MKSVLYHHTHFERLKSSVLRAAGINNIVTADCYPLSLKISDATGKRISETTLKRIFGFTTSSYKPSSYTLNCLSEYNGFLDWDHFCQAIDEQISVSEGNKWSWHRLRSAAMKISLFHLQGDQYKSGVPYNLTIPRHSVSQFIDGFLAGNATACVIDGPAGSGKTVAIAHWASAQMTASAHDIVLYTNNLSAQQHVLSGYDGLRWLAELMELSSPTLLEKVMSEYTKTAPGNFYLVIDETFRVSNTYPPNQQVFNELVSLVSHFSRYPWFRIIIVCRDTTFKQYRNHFYNLIVRPEWYSALSEQQGAEPVQPVVGAFSDVEIRTLLNRVNGLPEERLLFLPRELDIIRKPLLFQYYYKQENRKIDVSKANELDAYTIQTEYLEKTVHSLSEGTDTQLLLDELIAHIEAQDVDYYIVKKAVFTVIHTYSAAYHELLDSGILYEQTQHIDGQPQIVICFPSNEILGYFLSLRVLGGICKQKEPLVDIHTLSAGLRHTVMTWCIFLLARMDKIQLLSSLEPYWKDDASREEYIRFAVEAYHRIHAREAKQRQTKEVPEQLINLVCSTLSLSPTYHHTVAKMLDFNLDPERQVALRTVLALGGLLVWDEELFMRHLKELVWLSEADRGVSSSTINPHEAFVALYHHMVQQPTTGDQLQTLSDLLQRAAQLPPNRLTLAFYTLFYFVSHRLGDKTLLDQYAVLLQRYNEQREGAGKTQGDSVVQLLLGLNLADRGLPHEATAVLSGLSDGMNHPPIHFLAGLWRVQSARHADISDSAAQDTLLDWAEMRGLGFVKRILRASPAASS